MRLALKIAYDGTLYHGFARQPGIETIEGALEKNLREMGAIGSGEHLQVASRTDRGVSAAGNVVAFNTDMDSNSVVNALVHTLKGIWVVGFAEAPDDFNPRHALKKKYRYYLYNDGIDMAALKEAINLFVGEHDFTNFARLDGRNPIRKILKAKVSGSRILKIDFEGKSFLWNQVRRMVAAAEKAGRGEISIGELENAINGKSKINFGISPPENLLLVNLYYKKTLKFRGVEETGKFASEMAKKLEVKIAMSKDMVHVCKLPLTK